MKSLLAPLRINRAATYASDPKAAALPITQPIGVDVTRKPDTKDANVVDPTKVVAPKVPAICPAELTPVTTVKIRIV
jgi:hypothetical protein